MGGFPGGLGAQRAWCTRGPLLTRYLPSALPCLNAPAITFCNAPALSFPPCSQTLEGLSLQGNGLSGELFPPAWLAPGAMPHLTLMLLDNNAALAGSLPPKLPWPALTALSIAGTAVQPGAIPASWCSAPNAAIFTIM